MLFRSGETKTVSIPLGVKEMRTLTSDFRWVVEPGDFDVMVGTNSENILLSDSFSVTSDRESL